MLVTNSGLATGEAGAVSPTDPPCGPKGAGLSPREFQSLLFPPLIGPRAPHRYYAVLIDGLPHLLYIGANAGKPPVWAWVGGENIWESRRTPCEDLSQVVWLDGGNMGADLADKRFRAGDYNVHE